MNITGKPAKDVKFSSTYYNCTLAHNHPSGTLKPSRQDEQLTSKMKEAGSFLDIKVLDHLIVTSESYYSFADEGLL